MAIPGRRLAKKDIIITEEKRKNISIIKGKTILLCEIDEKRYEFYKKGAGEEF